MQRVCTVCLVDENRLIHGLGKFNSCTVHDMLKKKLLKKFLDQYIERLSNDGCNDFHLIKDGELSEEEAKIVAELLYKDEYSEDTSLCQSNWLVVQWLVDNLDSE